MPRNESEPNNIPYHTDPDVAFWLHPLHSNTFMGAEDELPHDEDTRAEIRSAWQRERTATRSLPKPDLPSTDKNYMDGIDWEEFSANRHMRTEHPITPNKENVGKQFIKTVEPIFDKFRDRPITREKDVQGYSIHDSSDDWRVEHEDNLDSHQVELPWGYNRRESVNNYRRLELRHNGSEVGHVAWDQAKGHVHDMGIDEGHRHMLGKLAQEAWDSSRKQKGYGPAMSNELSYFSRKLMEKYNPDSQEFHEYKRNQANVQTWVPEHSNVFAGRVRRMLNPRGNEDND